MMSIFLTTAAFVCGVVVGWFATWYVVFHVYEDDRW
jgi:hypothetical protein